MKTWLYYRIYAKPVKNWYNILLTEVVEPFVLKYDSLIESFFFFKYHHRYGVPPYDGLEAKVPKFNVGDEVWFIRFRLLLEEENLEELDESLNELMDISNIVIERELCEYDETRDLGGRFGESRQVLVRKYLEYASKITLSLLNEKKDDEYFKKISGLIHLPSNMLEYVLVSKCPQCGYEYIIPI